MREKSRPKFASMSAEGRMTKQKSASKTNGRVEVRDAIIAFLAKNPGKSHSLDDIKSSVKQNPALIIKELAAMSKDRFSKVKFSNESNNRGYHFIGTVDDTKSKGIDFVGSEGAHNNVISETPKARRLGKKSTMISIVSMVIESKGSPQPLDTKIIAERLGVEIGDIEGLIEELESSKAISGQYFEMFDQYILVATESSKIFLDELSSQLKENPSEEEQLYLFNDETEVNTAENSINEEFDDKYLSEIADKRVLSKISKSEKESIIRNAMDFAILSKLNDQGPHSITNLGSSLEGTASIYGFIGRNLIVKRVHELEKLGLVVSEQHSKLRQKYSITEEGIKSIPSEAIPISRNKNDSTDGQVESKVKNDKISAKPIDGTILNPAQSKNEDATTLAATAKQTNEIKNHKTRIVHGSTGFNDLYERGMLIIESMEDSDELKQILDEMLMLHNETNSKIEKITSFVLSVSGRQ